MSPKPNIAVGYGEFCEPPRIRDVLTAELVLGDLGLVLGDMYGISVYPVVKRRGSTYLVSPHGQNDDVFFWFTKDVGLEP